VGADYVGYSCKGKFLQQSRNLAGIMEFLGIPAGAGITAKFIPAIGAQEFQLLQEFLAGILSH
jgi:hypothetical protein